MAGPLASPPLYLEHTHGWPPRPFHLDGWPPAFPPLHLEHVEEGLEDQQADRLAYAQPQGFGQEALQGGVQGAQG